MMAKAGADRHSLASIDIERALPIPVPFALLRRIGSSFSPADPVLLAQL
jgi:hypothetical protein